MRKNKEMKFIVAALACILILLTALTFYKRNNLLDVFSNKMLSRIQNEREEVVEKLEDETIFVDTYPKVVVNNLWLRYRDKIQDDGRTIDRDRNYLTTSEGQSYSMLRAVWMDDKEVFESVWKWTRHNLQKRENDELFAWQWGETSEGNWDVLYENDGINTASDADQDIALALIFASKRWNEDDYLEEALPILQDIWEQEVVLINNKPYLTAGNWAADQEVIYVNPSYYNFAAYPIFAQVDAEHPWNLVKDTSYEILNKSTESPLDKSKSANLPPDWIGINRNTGELVVLDDKQTDFTEDAIRVPWRVALDWQWHKDPRAKEYFDNNLTVLKEEWENNFKIYARYSHDGEPLVEYESLSLYGALLPYLQITHPDTAKEIYKRKLATTYNADLEEFISTKEIGYYPQNWIWFGIAQYENLLPNLYTIEN